MPGGMMSGPLTMPGPIGGTLGMPTNPLDVLDDIDWSNPAHIPIDILNTGVDIIED